jgi:tetratricopeptide (TPR) repeat protein
MTTQQTLHVLSSVPNRKVPQATVYAAFVKSLETLRETESGEVALDILRLCAFLSPDGVDLALLTVEWGQETVPNGLAPAMSEPSAREDALAALVSLSLLKRENGPFDPVLIFHRLLLEVVRDWMGQDGRALWGTVTVELVNQLFPWVEVTTWETCGRLMPHVAQLEAHAPRLGQAGEALGRLLNQAGLYLTARGDREGALLFIERAVALARKSETEDPLNLSSGLSNLGGRYVDLDRLEEAEKAYHEALNIRESRLDQNDPSLGITLNNLGQVHWKRKEFNEAERLMLRAMEITKRAHRAREYGVALANLGALYSDWSDEPGQIARRTQEQMYKEQGLAVTRSVCGERHPEMAIRYGNIGIMKEKVRDWTGALAEFERALAIMLSLGLTEHPNTRDLILRLNFQQVRAGQSDRAARLRRGDFSDLQPMIAEVEATHHAWVAQNPNNRQFGPSSFFEQS